MSTLYNNYVKLMRLVNLNKRKAMGPTLPPPPLVYWGYPTPPVSPAHYYHPPHHPQTMMPEVLPVGGGSPIPIPPPACTEWPIFMVN